MALNGYSNKPYRSAKYNLVSSLSILLPTERILVITPFSIIHEFGYVYQTIFANFAQVSWRRLLPQTYPNYGNAGAYKQQFGNACQCRLGLRFLSSVYPMYGQPFSLMWAKFSVLPKAAGHKQKTSNKALCACVLARYRYAKSSRKHSNHNLGTQRSQMCSFPKLWE